MFGQLAVTATRFGCRLVLLGKKYLPEILVGTGIIGTIGATIAACGATIKAEEVLNKYDEMMAKTQEALNNPNVNYTEEDLKKDEKTIKIKKRWGVFKAYAPVFTLLLVSVLMILSGFRILHIRSAATAAAYKAVESAYRSYRQGVIDRYGEDADIAILKGDIPAAKIEEMNDPELKDAVMNEVSKMPSLSMGIPSPYAVYFSADTSKYWRPDYEMNRFFLNQTQKNLNEQFHARGYLFLNEVYEALGMKFGEKDLPYTAAGQVVGWVLSKDFSTDNLVDFGLYDEDNRSARAFLAGKSNRVLLDFNVDGVVYDQI